MIDFRPVKILQDFLDFLRIGDFVQITENNNILIRTVLQSPAHRIFLEGIPVMGIARWRIIHHHMNDFVRKFREHFLIFLIIQRLWVPGKGFRGLADDKPVHHRVHNMKPQLQNIQFIKKLETVIYHFNFLPSACHAAFLRSSEPYAFS